MFVEIMVLRAVQNALWVDAIKFLKVKTFGTYSNYLALKG
jgi:hypothetical protein